MVCKVLYFEAQYALRLHYTLILLNDSLYCPTHMVEPKTNDLNSYDPEHCLYSIMFKASSKVLGKEENAASDQGLHWLHRISIRNTPK